MPFQTPFHDARRFDIEFVTACEDHDDGAPITSGGALLTALGNRSLLFASVHELMSKRRHRLFRILFFAKNRLAGPKPAQKK